MPLGELNDHAKGYLVNHTCIVEADAVIRKVIDYWTHYSKKARNLMLEETLGKAY